MKIAVITDDGKTISQHFGRAQYYLVVSVENGQVLNRELRDKLGHGHFSNEPHEPELPGQQHGFSPAAQDRHTRMAGAITDCQTLLCGGMGMGAYESIKALGIQTILTDITSIDDAVTAFVEGRIVDRSERLH